MSRAVSVGTKIEQIAGLLGTGDLTDWQTEFVSAINRVSNGGKNTPALSDRQVEIIEEIWERHFA